MSGSEVVGRFGANEAFSYDEEVSLTRELIERGDRKHALQHCIGALALEPQRTEWQPLLRGLLGMGDLRRSLDEDPYYGAKAALAWHLHDQRELRDALDLIGSVTVTVPHLGFQQWFGAWLEEAGAAGIDVDPGTVLPVLLLGTSFGIGRVRLLPTEQAAARDLAPIARFAARLLQDPQVFMLASAVLRRAGEYPEAIAMAERARAAGGEPAQVATVVGLAMRAAGNPHSALEVFDGAYQRTHDVIYLQEKFRALVDAGRWTEANQLAAEIRESKPPDEEAEMEYTYVELAARHALPVPDAPPLDDIRRRSLGHGWLPEGTAMPPKPPAPAAAVLHWIEELCDSSGDDFLAMWKCAVAPPAAAADEWAAAIGHPRIENVSRWQIAALIGLARAQPGWMGTAKRDVLLALLRAAVDIELPGAIRVAAEVALREPDAVREIRQALIDLVRVAEHVTNPGILTALLVSLQMLPYVGRNYIDTVYAALSALQSDDDN